MFHEHAYSVRLLDGIGIPLVPISELIQLILHRLWKRAADLASKILIVMMRNESGLHFLIIFTASVPSIPGSITSNRHISGFTFFLVIEKITIGRV